ncbi:MAG: DinB family protein [Actinobacteria bacterium]|nr:DinB family protein [Actinomycetota bacterium]
MQTFDSQLGKLLDSANRICDEAKRSSWNGEGWAPPIILGHVSDVDKEVWMARFELMRNAAHAHQAPPHLSWWEPDPVRTAGKYASFTIEQAVSNLEESRKEMVRFLELIPVADRGASAMHQTFGLVSVESMLSVILDHDEEHRRSLMQ